ncbi:MAG: hypothetical protein OEY64_06720 [Nitrospinota bacterium]|nr:hypothetical protein [Nitrospinota bacterium]
MVKIEMANSRFVRTELKDHASEFIHYAKYAGYMLGSFNKHLALAKIYPLKPEIAERNHRLIIETTLANAKILFQITQIYPSFKNWMIKPITPGVELGHALRKKLIQQALAENAEPKPKSAKTTAKKNVVAKPKTAKKSSKTVKKSVKKSVAKKAKVKIKKK